MASMRGIMASWSARILAISLVTRLANRSSSDARAQSATSGARSLNCTGSNTLFGCSMGLVRRTHKFVHNLVMVSQADFVVLKDEMLFRPRFQHGLNVLERCEVFHQSRAQHGSVVLLCESRPCAGRFS